MLTAVEERECTDHRAMQEFQRTVAAERQRLTDHLQALFEARVQELLAAYPGLDPMEAEERVEDELDDVWEDLNADFEVFVARERQKLPTEPPVRQRTLF